MLQARNLSISLICLSIVVHCTMVRAEEAQPDAPPPNALRRCVDMNGHEFYWSWSNVPFASSCSSVSPSETSGKTEACRASCVERFGSCSSGSLDKKQIDACFEGMEGCQTACAAEKN
jgi:hypothetical protein